MTVKANKKVLYIAMVCFLGWIGFLAYLASQFTNPQVVSRSQMMMVTDPLVVEVIVKDDRVSKVLAKSRIAPDPKNDQNLQAQEIDVLGLDLAKVLGGKTIASGEYFFPLTQTNPQEFRLVAAPRSPGLGAQPRPVIYLWTPDIEKQVRALIPKQ